ncbi:MAG: hypothetical protein OXI86_22820, partial [Candidatus Poribacteria bacterium]|nr:hypothetical protein [Candidatus Poribacteria bacterium]
MKLLPAIDIPLRWSGESRPGDRSYRGCGVSRFGNRSHRGVVPTDLKAGGRGISIALAIHSLDHHTTADSRFGNRSHREVEPTDLKAGGRGISIALAIH